MATKRRMHVTRANAQNGVRKQFWPEYRKVATVHAHYISGPFTVETREGVLDMPEGGWLALDDEDYPYPIEAGVFARIYEPVDGAGVLGRCCRLHGTNGQHEAECPEAIANTATRSEDSDA